MTQFDQALSRGLDALLRVDGEIVEFDGAPVSATLHEESVTVDVGGEVQSYDAQARVRNEDIVADAQGKTLVANGKTWYVNRVQKLNDVSSLLYLSEDPLQGEQP